MRHTQRSAGTELHTHTHTQTALAGDRDGWVGVFTTAGREWEGTDSKRVLAVIIFPLSLLFLSRTKKCRFC